MHDEVDGDQEEEQGYRGKVQEPDQKCDLSHLHDHHKHRTVRAKSKAVYLYVPQLLLTERTVWSKAKKILRVSPLDTG